ncbi:MAG: hypothetical protein IKC38_05115 [Clostridia bacterium]|nr:hypothetical protein [Clostridia bacterium]
MKKHVTIILVLLFVFVNICNSANAEVLIEGYCIDFDRRETMQLLKLDKGDAELATQAEEIGKEPYALYYASHFPLEERNKYVADLIGLLETLKLPQTRHFFREIFYSAAEGKVTVQFWEIEYELCMPTSEEYKIFSEDSGYDCEPRQIGQVLLYQSSENETIGSNGESSYAWEGYLELNEYRFKCYSKKEGYDEEKMISILSEAPLYTMREAYIALGLDPDDVEDAPSKEPIQEATPTPTIKPTDEPVKSDIGNIDDVKVVYWICAAVSVIAIVGGAVVIVVAKNRG